MKATFLTIIMTLWSLVSFGQQWEATLISSTEFDITIDIQVTGFQSTSVITPHGEACVISIPKAANNALAGEPNLPMIPIPVIIGDNALMQVQVSKAEYVDYEGVEVAPSKGDFPRSINPDDVPYTYGEAYRQNAFFPQQLAKLDEPYIHRDVRGQNLMVTPLLYNPVTKTLRVYNHLVLNMIKIGVDDRNTITNRPKSLVLDPEFKAIYENRYINYQASMAKYTPIEENGELLIICHDAFMAAMEPYVLWKKQIGRPTSMVGTSTSGATEAALRTYITDYYNTHPNLTDILLVGDVEQIPGAYVSAGSGVTGYSGYGDLPYGQTAGNDSYNEVIVGRFCCETEAQVTNQVNKVLNYERDLDATATWLTVGQGVSTTSQGGHFNEQDYQHIDYIRNDLLNYNYTDVYRDYQNVNGSTASNATVVSQHINEGVSIINYCNHGSTTSWGVFSYSNSHVNALTNDYKLPYIISVACLNGKYDHPGGCFAEAWMRATNNSTGNPTGAIGGMFSYISQPWTPPQYGQDEMIDILVESKTGVIRRTMGGVSINGNLRVLDLGATSNPNKGTYNCWVLYGDPTLTLRNAVPTDMNVSHNPFINLSTTIFPITTTDGDGALATLTRNGEIMGSATISDGTAIIEFDAPTTTGEATLTVFGYNKVTYIATVNIVPDGSIYPTPPTNVTATVNNQDVLLSWNASTPADSYNVYRNNVMIAQNLTALNYTDSGLEPGTYHYQVSTVYDNMESMKSGIVEAIVYAPMSVTVTASETIYVPNPIPGGWTGISLTANATGGNGNYTYSWTPTDAVNHPTAQTTTASPEKTTTYTCTVSSNGQSVSDSVTVIVVTPPSQVDAEIIDETSVRITWNEADYADSYLIYRGENLIASGLTDLTYIDEFHSIGQVCYYVKANYQGHLSQSELACVYFCATPENVTAEYEWNDGDYFTRISWHKNSLVNYDIDMFFIYRSENSGDDFQLIGEVENEDYVYDYHFDDTTATTGSYYYYVSATYKYEDCVMRSELVHCIVTGIGEHHETIRVYPNPTSGVITIESAGQKQIHILNSLGQTIFQAIPETPSLTIDLSTFGSGIYLLQAHDKNGMTTKKVIVK